MALSITAAIALPINSPVPDNATITWNGLQWAWGGACPYAGNGCYATGDLSYQGTLGWRLPTDAEFALVTAYDAVDTSAFAKLFFYPGANVPAGGSDPVSGAAFTSAGLVAPGAGACAVPYFANFGVTWCDESDGAAGNWSGPVGMQNSFDQLYVRSLAAGPVTVPEPFSLSIFGAGLAGLAALRRRKKSVTA